MPKPIIKRSSVQLENADFEEFVAQNKSIIRSSNVVEVSDEEELLPNKKKRHIIRGSDVRVQSEGIEICLFDFAGESHTPPLAGSAKEEIALEEEEEIISEDFQEFQRTIEAEWQLKLENAAEEARKSGYAEGFNDAKQEYEKKAEQSKRAFESGLARFKVSWENYLKRSETILMQIALEITQFIIDAPLPKKYSDVTQAVLNDALDHLSHETPLSLSLNPLDLLRLQESGMMDVMKEKFPALRWDPQPTLKEGNWIIQTPKQAVRRISDEILDHLKDQFGLADHGQADIEVNSTVPGYEIEYIPPVTNVAVSTTPVPLSEPLSSDNLSKPPTTLSLAEEQLQNVAFSPATSTANGPSTGLSDLSEIKDSDS